MSVTIEERGWVDFLENFRWNSGEHVTLIGPTGQGKTTLATNILDRRKYVAAMAQKPQDPLIGELVTEKGYYLCREWPPPEPREHFNRVVFWPRNEKVSDIPNQHKAFKIALTDIYQAGGWCVYLDEARYVTQFLRLAPLCELLWLQGRSLKVSLVVGTQRPAWIPLSAYDQATHLFLWRENDATNLARLSGLGGVNTSELRDVIANLERYQFCYVNTRSGEMTISRVELEEKKGAA